MVYGEEKPEFRSFDEAIIPREGSKDKSKEELQKIERAFHEQQSELKKLQDELAKIKALKDQNIAFIPPPIDPNEDTTRKLYIDTLMREAGWDPYGTNVPEYPVKNCMPQASGSNGDGKVDYVLWGDDGKPVAVVEAKRTSRDPRVGQHQAKCYADCIEKEFGQRPVIFYTNGFQTWMWDDLNYAPREVFGFYTKDELQTLIQRRIFKKPLATQIIDDAITDRYYQHEAIRKIAEALENNHRVALLVMATGVGKTRVAASLIDFLSKANWAKRILFLADRNALIHQAQTNLNDYLPHLPAVDLTKQKEDESSRIVFSTYQTKTTDSPG
jgi:type I restriction enzyme R subunit